MSADLERRLRLYHAELPAFLPPFLDTSELRRLRDVGMNCGCEYTAFPRFAACRPIPAFPTAWARR